MSVYKKLQQARVKLHSMKLSKSGENKFAGFKYFELGDFLTPIQTIFDEAGLCGVVTFTREEATLTIVDIESGLSIIFQSPMSDVSLKGCHPVQNMGAVQTYIRRYLWVMAMEIVEHDAVDSSTGKPEKTTQKPVGNPLLPVVETIRQLTIAEPVDYPAIKEIWKQYDESKITIMWKMLNSKEKDVVRFAIQGEAA